ncbi:propyzamide-hypersensitive 1 [Reticulomyxa filosa]|uniref:protein-tyrosine-phosphatase n=1 Tax=Reticulomyxa filosa TaxID=46433 RepID=X6P8Z0_RETFI|nr:propyzamide-hypersensitive 1 [Reticulomyxa filosa]|eukprot:ETO34112.1 propyzamide-hypersensitive 1 [Reticulomyxa filosa]
MAEEKTEEKEAPKTPMMHQIIDKLYLGSFSYENVAENGIQCILNCAKEIEVDTDELFHNEKYKGLIKHYKHFPLNDVNGEVIDMSLYNEALEFIYKNIHENKYAVLVHCFEGRSRSATVVLGYLMKYEKDMSLSKAYKLVKSKRSAIRPNETFWLFLMNLELKLFNTDKNTVASDAISKHAPKSFVCPFCQKNCGFRQDALTAHITTKHKDRQE